MDLDSDPSARAESIDWNVARKAFENLLAKSESEHDPSIFADIVQGKLVPQAKLDGIASYVKRMGASLTASPEGHVFLNGRHFDMNEVCRACLLFRRLYLLLVDGDAGITD